MVVPLASPAPRAGVAGGRPASCLDRAFGAEHRPGRSRRGERVARRRPESWTKGEERVAPRAAAPAVGSAAPGGARSQRARAARGSVEGSPCTFGGRGGDRGARVEDLRNDLTDLGMSPKDRVSPRTGHPTRLLLDRLAKAAGVETVELVISPGADANARARAGRAVDRRAARARRASRARAGRRRWRVRWCESRSPSRGSKSCLRFMWRRCWSRSHGRWCELRRQRGRRAAAEARPAVRAERAEKFVTKAQAARSRRLPPLLTTRDAAPPQGRGVSRRALARAELRAAFLLTGNLLALFEELRRFDVELARGTDRPGPTALSAILDHPYAGDLTRYALTAEATALRRRTGATW